MRRITLTTIAALALLPAAVVPGAHAHGGHASVGGSTAAAPQVVHYVSLGDSVTTVTPSFVDTVARAAGVALHRKVTVAKVVEDGDVSVLVGRVKTDPTLRAALKSADLITITIGANEIGNSPNRTTEKGFEQSYRALLDQLTRLRPRSRAAYRLLTSFDTPSVFPPAVGKSFTALLRAENRLVCAQAAGRGMKCADVYAAFNGIDGSRDPLDTGLVIPDGHPSAKGEALIAKVVVALGFAPLH